jgi:hypothetical protein
MDTSNVLRIRAATTIDRSTVGARRCGALLAGAVFALALRVPPAPAQVYVGTGKCKVCHAKAELGDQHAKWKATKHAQTYEVLATAEAREQGKKMGVSDPQTDIRCLICHVTAADAPAAAKEKVRVADGVSCEACHGPGSEWKSEDVHGKDRKAALAAGMRDLKNPSVLAATCNECHSGSRKGHKAPNPKPFDLKERLAKIEHRLPAKTKGK